MVYKKSNIFKLKKKIAVGQMCYSNVKKIKERKLSQKEEVSYLISYS